ncbi:MAG: anti-sigma factor [Streptosporangiaceae bacterium]
MSTPDNLHALTGAYAVDALDDIERRTFERHLATCETCAEEVRELREAGARLGAAAAETPPPELWERVRAAAATTPQLPPTHSHVSGRGARGWTRVFLAAAACLLLVAVGLGAWNAELHRQLNQTQRASDRVAAVLAAPDAAIHTKHLSGTGTASVVVSHRRHAAVFVGSDLPDLPQDRTYELWAITASGPHPAGLFQTGTRGRVVHLLDSRLAAAHQVALTIEPAGGSPQPTTTPIFAVNVGA